MKSPFKGRKPTTTGHAQGHGVPILQRRDVELFLAWQDLSAVMITSVSSWPTLWC